MNQTLPNVAPAGRAPLATLLRLVQVSLGLRLVLDVVGLIGATLAFDAGVMGLVALASLPSLGLLVLTFVAPSRGWVTARFISALLVAILVGQMLEGVVFQAMLRALLPRGGRVKICTTCINRCGIGQGEVIPEAILATMADLAAWITESERVLVF